MFLSLWSLSLLLIVPILTLFVCVVGFEVMLLGLVMDFSTVSDDLLKRFLECKNMRNIEVLSFKSEG